MTAENVLATRESDWSEAVPQQVQAILAASELAKLIDALVRKGYEVVGPTVRDGAIVYDQIESVQDLPAGWTDEQAPGHYRLKRRDDDALFGYVVGPAKLEEVSAPRRSTSLVRRTARRNLSHPEQRSQAQAPQAFLGVRACELAAIAVQDRVLLEDKYRDPIYGARRSGAFMIAVQCTQSAATCFCASMETGPAVSGETAADLVLTELVGPPGITSW